MNNEASLDDLIESDIPAIDWHSVTEAEGTELGQALGEYRGMQQKYDIAKASWKVHSVALMSAGAVGVALQLLGVSPMNTAWAVLFSQLGRLFFLDWKKDMLYWGVGKKKQEAFDVVKRISERHPNVRI